MIMKNNLPVGAGMSREGEWKRGVAGCGRGRRRELRGVRGGREVRPVHQNGRDGKIMPMTDYCTTQGVKFINLLFCVVPEQLI